MKSPVVFLAQTRSSDKLAQQFGGARHFPHRRLVTQHNAMGIGMSSDTHKFHNNDSLCATIALVSDFLPG